jgi:hypothetical protein
MVRLISDLGDKSLYGSIPGVQFMRLGLSVTHRMTESLHRHWSSENINMSILIPFV